jgi:hypothetical protein
MWYSWSRSGLRGACWSWPETKQTTFSVPYRLTCSPHRLAEGWSLVIGGIRKGRCANPGRGKGKRGGYRYLYLFLARQDHVHLLFLLDKDEQEDLTSAERAILRRLVAQIEEE